MRPVYTVEFSEKFFGHYSDEVLANMALDYLNVFKAANYDDERGIKALERHGRIFSKDRLRSSCVSASRDSIVLDFSRASIQGWAATQVFESETLINELLSRKKKKGIIFDQDVDILYALETAKALRL